MFLSKSSIPSVASRRAINVGAKTQNNFTQPLAKLWLPRRPLLFTVQTIPPPRIKILQEGWSLFGDEAGHGNLDKGSDWWFVYAIIGVPHDTLEGCKKRLISLWAGKAKHDDRQHSLSQLGESLVGSGARAYVSYFDLKELGKLELHWSRQKQKSRNRGIEVTSRNLLWMNAISCAVIGIVSALGSESVGPLEIYFDEKSLKLRERDILENTYKGLFSRKLREMCESTRQEGRRRGVPIFESADPHIVSLQTTSGNNPFIITADVIASLVHKELTMRRQLQFPPWIEVEDSTYGLTRWLQKEEKVVFEKEGQVGLLDAYESGGSITELKDTVEDADAT